MDKKLEKSLRQMSALNDLGKSPGSSLKLDDTLDLVAENMKRIIDCQSIIIFLTHRDNSEVELVPRRCRGR